MSITKRKSLGPVLVVGLFAVCGSWLAADETQTFDSAESAEADGWVFNDEAQNSARDCEGCETDLGWRPSNNAGGTEGEGGGLLHRSFSLPIGFYADVSIGELTLEMPFGAGGQLSLNNIDFDGHAYLGFFDALSLLEDPTDFGAEAGFNFAEPGGGVDPNFRWGRLFTGDDLMVDHNNSEFVDGIPDGEPVEFAIFYEPNVGAGTFTFLLGDEPPVTYALSETQRDAGATFNAFGIFTGHHGGTARADSMEIFIDDLTYTSLDGGEVADLDFNGDTFIDVVDLDLLVGEIVANNGDTNFDLNGDGAVDDMDLSTWLSDAARDNGFGQPYLPGDANLDGSVNANDLNALALRWQQQIATWSGGDFTANGTVDAADLNVMAINWQQEIPTAASAVPEPTSAWLLLWMFLVGLVAHRERRRR